MANDIIPSTGVIILLAYLLWRDFYTDANLKQHWVNFKSIGNLMKLRLTLNIKFILNSIRIIWKFSLTQSANLCGNLATIINSLWISCDYLLCSGRLLYS